eukprot:10892554-Heterocapsa_arctica.AAC.1
MRRLARRAMGPREPPAPLPHISAQDLTIITTTMTMTTTTTTMTPSSTTTRLSTTTTTSTSTTTSPFRSRV